VSNGPTEAANNLIKRVKPVAFGFRRFAHYPIRVLHYAGKPNWELLPTPVKSEAHPCLMIVARQHAAGDRAPERRESTVRH
jgi:hypothetical protein